MRLRDKLPETSYALVRGYGDVNAPKAGAEALPQLAFMTKAEIEASASLQYQPGSIFLGRVDDQMIGVKDNRHIITLAGSRSGKSACVLIPNLLLYPGSVLVIDPKGELAEATAHHRATKLGQKVVVLDPFKVARGDAVQYRASHNPLAEIDDESERGADTLIDNAALVAEAIIEDSGEGKDSYWISAARNLIQAMVLRAIMTGAPLPTIRQDLMADPKGLETLFDGMAGFGLFYADEAVADGVKEAANLVSRVGNSMLGRINTNEGSGVIASAIEQLAFLESPPMRDLMSGHDISLRDLKAGPVSLYLVLPAGRVGTHARWLRLMTSLALSVFEEQRDAKPEHPVLMILEEFAALGYLRPVEQAAGFIAGSDVRLWSVLQDVSQLMRHYKDGWETFIGNAGVLQAFSLTDQKSLEFISKRLGETTVEVITPQEARTRDLDQGASGVQRSFQTVPLLSPAEVAIAFRRLSSDGSARGGRALVLWSDTYAFIVDRVWWEDLIA